MLCQEESHPFQILSFLESPIYWIRNNCPIFWSPLVLLPWFFRLSSPHSLFGLFRHPSPTVPPEEFKVKKISGNGNWEFLHALKALCLRMWASMGFKRSGHNIYQHLTPVENHGRDRGWIMTIPFIGGSKIAQATQPIGIRNTAQMSTM